MRVIVAFIILVICGTTAVAADVRRTLALSGLSCVACSAAVTKALKQVEGVREVTVSKDQAQAVVVTDESVPPSTLIQAVEKAGYKATEDATSVPR